MKRFQYKAKTREGQSLQGTVDADDKTSAINKLRGQNFYITSIKEIDTRFAHLFQKRGRIKPSQLAVLCRHFSIQLETGLSLVASLQLLEEEAADQRVKEALQQCRLEVASGSAFAKSLEKHKALFPSIFIRLIEAGEMAGVLPAVLERLAIYYEREDELRKKISEALMYPMVICVFALIVVSVLLFVVLPMFANIFQQFGAELPIITRVVLRFREILVDFWFVWLLLIISVTFFFRWYSSTASGRYRLDYLKLHVPIVGNISKMVIISRFCRTLGLLLNSGISMLRSLEMLQRLMGNVVISSALGEARVGVERGQGLTAPLKAKKVFPSMLIQMVAVGEETGNLERTLVQLSDFYDREVNYAVTRFTKLLEPIVMFFLAVVVLFIAVSVLQPMMGMFQHF